MTIKTDELRREIQPNPDLHNAKALILFDEEARELLDMLDAVHSLLTQALPHVDMAASQLDGEDHKQAVVLSQKIREITGMTETKT